VWPKVARSRPKVRIRRELESSNVLVLQRFSRVEWVTGIEPALSAWELLERMGISVVRSGFLGHERPGLSCGCPP